MDKNAYNTILKIMRKFRVGWWLRVFLFYILVCWSVVGWDGGGSGGTIGVHVDRGSGGRAVGVNGIGGGGAIGVYLNRGFIGGGSRGAVGGGRVRGGGGSLVVHGLSDLVGYGGLGVGDLWGAVGGLRSAIGGLRGAIGGLRGTIAQSGSAISGVGNLFASAIVQQQVSQDSS